VHRQKALPTQQLERLERIFGTEMDVAPGGMKRAHLQRDQIERAELLLDAGVLAGQARVAAEEEGVPLAPHDERRPSGGVLHTRAAAGKMLGGRGPNLSAPTGDGGALPPIQLGDTPGRDAPRLQVRADTQAGKEAHLALGQLQHGGVVEMIVVVVRDDDGVERREVAQLDRHRVKALRTGKAYGRHALTPHRIGQHPNSVELQQERRMAEPGDA
jgi:hypothetical protein